MLRKANAAGEGTVRRVCLYMSYLIEALSVHLLDSLSIFEKGPCAIDTSTCGGYVEVRVEAEVISESPNVP